MAFKKDKMTRVERFAALLKRQPVDRVSLAGGGLGFSGVNVGYEIRDVYADPQKMVDATTWTAEQYDWDALFILHGMDGGYEVRCSSVFGRRLDGPNAIAMAEEWAAL